MAEPIITVTNLTKVYQVPERAPGLKASLQTLVKPQYRDVEAVIDINFSIKTGEMVALIG